MSTKVYHIEFCSHCGMLRDAQHDAQCWTIARALSLDAKGIASEAQGHVAQLARWLREHPAPRTPQGRHARES